MVQTSTSHYRAGTEASASPAVISKSAVLISFVIAAGAVAAAMLSWKVSTPATVSASSHLPAVAPSPGACPSHLSPGSAAPPNGSLVTPYQAIWGSAGNTTNTESALADGSRFQAIWGKTSAKSREGQGRPYQKTPAILVSE